MVETELQIVNLSNESTSLASSGIAAFIGEWRALNDIMLMSWKCIHSAMSMDPLSATPFRNPQKTDRAAYKFVLSARKKNGKDAGQLNSKVLFNRWLESVQGASESSKEAHKVN